jgi:hypothetical protein
MILARFDAPLRGQLVDLAFGDDAGRPAEDAQHLEAAVLDHQLESAREQEVADQHARRIAPDDVGGAPPASQPGAVDHVVVSRVAVWMNSTAAASLWWRIRNSRAGARRPG